MFKSAHAVKISLIIFILLLVYHPIFTHFVYAKPTEYLPINNPSNFLRRTKIDLLTDDQSFVTNKVILVDFESVKCCKILTDEYKNSSGVEFVNSIGEGWATYQANGFSGHLNTSVFDPGAPKGVTGTKVILGHKTSKVGMYLQAGGPMDKNAFRPAKKIKVLAYDGDGNQIFTEETDTCLKKSSSCQAQFIGVEASKDVIKSFEIIMNEKYSWAIDNLKVEGRHVFHQTAITY